VHRDLKPQNVFLVPTEVDGREVEIAKVLDFGISKIRGSQTVKTQDSALLGTPQYMAPEQAMGQQDSVDERTDVFALGAIVYEMLSGQPAFPGASIPEVVFKVVYEQPAPLAPLAPSAPPGLVAAVLQAMAKRSEERFPTVTAFVEAITGKPLTAARAQAPAPTGSPSAFAQTMGSGDLGGSPERPMLATMPPAGADSASAASTSRVTRVPSASQLPGGSSAPASAAAPTVDLHAGPDARSPRPRRRSLGALAVIALAGAAVATGAVYVAMHRGAPSSHGPAQGAGPADNPDRHVAVVTSGPQASDRPAEPRPAEPRPAEPRPAEPRPARKPEVKPAPRAHGKPEPGPAAGEDQAMPGDDGDAAVREQLKEAAAALDRHDYDLAERLANTVVNSPAGPKQRAAARLIHGTIQCVARNDQEAAQIDLRNLERFRALRTRLLNVCRSHGVLSSP
jgi:serine/threonine-protein kinase